MSVSGGGKDGKDGKGFGTGTGFGTGSGCSGGEPQIGPSTLLTDPLDDQLPSLTNFESNAHTSTQHGGNPEVATALGLSPLRNPSVDDSGSSAQPRAPASVSSFTRIRRLAEPSSTRKRSTREDIILFKASMVNGFKCPPWDKPPSSSEFLAQEDAEFFV
jgi:hypothetical protein